MNTPSHPRTSRDVSEVQTRGDYHNNGGNATGTSPTSSEDDVTLREALTSPESSLPRSAASPMSRWVPVPVVRVANAVGNWVRGPDPPRRYKIYPLFPRIQEAPIRLLQSYFPKRRHKIALLVPFYAAWLLCFALVLHKSAFAGDIPGYGSPTRLNCLARYWADGNGCGLNGDLCRPFANSSLAFRCPANCKRVEILNPHAVGDQEINYRSLLIGGPVDSFVNNGTVTNTIYRGDSFICSAAIHAGFISNARGGCGVLSLTGTQSQYPSTESHGLRSIAFDSYFPLSFSFLHGTSSECRDLRWPLLAVSLTFTVLLSLFTTSPSVFVATLFPALFFHVALASDPPNLTDYHAIISLSLGRFLPAAFCLSVLYRYAIRRTLFGLTAQVERTILWLGGAWVGALNNYTFDKIPIQRLTPHDIHAQPGAIPALIFIVLALFGIALCQAWCLRTEGRLPRFLALYALLGAGLVGLVLVPGMNVRIHHYILALLLLPGTGMQTRPSLLFQGLLVGLFINGVARWGFDSILQTPGDLRGDARLGSPLPVILPPVINLNEGLGQAWRPNITFSWESPFPEGWDGLSVLVNDVERFRGYADQGLDSWTWVKKEEGEGMPEYFRFGYMSGSVVGDYTKAGVWGREGGWREMGPGPS
ncbi:hypothetical protein W97_02182 [Coniosporium apollinis CBS 100218]|uniref:LCCL domain-containing protein n=1 Tax=Coniosporium apollinis (strain CBS 100218) TaxID=1168221 RepID=R7YMS4_CONA1|nr:uncharacterized protein W97_02182 [Coniosporium apollinis CBS 100218]EON62956.1 hypothetical protein W97_02182 [Coniosporium apollinis CBS 100218]